MRKTQHQLSNDHHYVMERQNAERLLLRTQSLKPSSGIMLK